MQAVTAKGQTPASNSPDDIVTAIGKIITGGGTGSEYLRYTTPWVQAYNITSQSWENIFKTENLPLTIAPGTHLYCYLNYTEYYSGAAHSGYVGTDTTYGKIETQDSCFNLTNDTFICQISGFYNIILGYRKGNAGVDTASKVIVYHNGSAILTADGASLEFLHDQVQTMEKSLTLSQGDTLQLYCCSGSWGSCWGSLEVTT